MFSSIAANLFYPYKNNPLSQYAFGFEKVFPFLEQF